MDEKKDVGMGLLPRLILGIFIPILLAFIIIGFMIFFTVNIGGLQVKSIKDIGNDSLRELSSIALKESTSSLNLMGEKAIREKAEMVSKEVEIYLRSNPVISDIKNDNQLKILAVQKVGQTGYTALNNMATCYYHPDPNIAGMDLSQLATKLPEFWKIIEASLRGPSWGYYDWKDPDGKVRPKYMYMAPVKGTPYIVAATTYIDEFSAPAKMIINKLNEIEKTYSGQYAQKFHIFYIVVLLDLLILLIVIYVYALTIIRPIHYLSEVADKISMGDLKTSVQTKATGEVKLLADAIERMQASVRAAIDRLQRRRGE